jgi:hypothetical protein
LVPRLFRIISSTTGTLALLAGLIRSATLLLIRFLARSLVLLTGLVLVRHVVSFHGNAVLTARTPSAFLRKKSRITTIRHYSAMAMTYLSSRYSQSQEQALLESADMATRSGVSEVDQMSTIYPVSVHRRIERQWANRMKSLQSRMVIAAEKKLRRAFKEDSLLKSVEAAAIGGPTTIRSVLTA